MATIVSTQQYNITAYISQLANYPLYGFDTPDVYYGIKARPNAPAPETEQAIRNHTGSPTRAYPRIQCGGV